jgi:hypothetical protein
VLGALAAGDTFVVTDDTTTFESISFLNVAAPTVPKLQTALDNSASVTLGVDTTIAAGSTVTVPAGVTLTVAAGKTLDLSATGAAVVLEKHANTAIVLSPTIDSLAADGGGAAIKFTAGTTHAKSKVRQILQQSGRARRPAV